jgi:signal peptidase I
MSGPAHEDERQPLGERTEPAAGMPAGAAGGEGAHGAPASADWAAAQEQPAAPPPPAAGPAPGSLWATGADAPHASAAPGGDGPGAPGAPAPAAPEPRFEPAPRRGRLQRFRAWRFAPLVEILVTIGIALGLAESVQAAIVKPFVIPTGSMEPTLEPSQRVLVNRLAYDFGSPHRGDIVVFHPPNSLACGSPKTPPDEPCPKSVSTPSSQYFVKRIMGLPGDHLYIKDGHPVINGREITNEPYTTPCGAVPACNMPIVITIPKGEYYMLGDNRGDSDDSRYWGPVPASWIVGEVFATYWPPDRIGIF